MEFDFSKVLKPGERLRFLVLVDLAPETMEAGISFFLPARFLFSSACLRRGTARGKVLALACGAVAFLGTVPMGCGGGGSSSHAASREVRFDLLNTEDISIVGSVSGSAATVGGLPLKGPSLDL